MQLRMEKASRGCCSLRQCVIASPWHMQTLLVSQCVNGTYFGEYSMCCQAKQSAHSWAAASSFLAEMMQFGRRCG